MEISVELPLDKDGSCAGSAHTARARVQVADWRVKTLRPTLPAWRSISARTTASITAAKRKRAVGD